MRPGRRRHPGRRRARRRGGPGTGLAITIILALATTAFTLNTLRRTDFERARQLHADLTTGAVAEARHAVGSALEGTRRAGTVDLDSNEIQALFIVLWCLERIDVARGTLLGRWRHLPGWINPRRALDDSIRLYVEMYIGYIHRARVDGVPVRDTLAATERDPGLLRLAESLGIQAQQAPQTGEI